VECEALLASLRITARMGISRLSVRGDSQLTVSQAEGTELSPLMKAYACEIQKLECRFQSLKLEHVPRGQDAAVKELSRIAAKGLPVPFGVDMEKLSQPSVVPEEEDPRVQPASEQGILPAAELQQSRQTRQASGALCPLRLAGLTEW
jgi:hypothetical protein